MEFIGWVATAAFASSYFFENPAHLRRVQAGAALLWVAYGLVIHSWPVIIANIIVMTIALWSTFSPRRASVESGADSEPA
jgi:hypothetical protein